MVARETAGFRSSSRCSNCPPHQRLTCGVGGQSSTPFDFNAGDRRQSRREKIIRVIRAIRGQTLLRWFREYPATETPGRDGCVRRTPSAGIAIYGPLGSTTSASKGTLGNIQNLAKNSNVAMMPQLSPMMTPKSKMPRQGCGIN